MELPKELLVEILGQLPVKTLIRFTCVCKYWYSIITSSEFASKHYSTRIKLNHPYDFDSMLTEFSPAVSMSIFSYHDLTFQTAFKIRPAVEPYDPPKFGINRREIVSICRTLGPCNGLFLLEFSKCQPVWFLWNPAVRDAFRVPIPLDFRIQYLGFAFDDVTNDYKIVCFDYQPAINLKSCVCLYSRAANSWHQLDITLDIGYGGYLYQYDICSNNGRYHHWIMMSESTTSFLLSFDVVDQVFVHTPMPFAPRDGCKFLEQGSNNTNVYPIVYYFDFDKAGKTTISLHIWGLNKYGPTGSWNELKSLTVPILVSSTPILLWKNNAIVFPNRADQHAITRYDLITQEMTSLGHQFRGDKTIVAYTESLVSVAKFVPPTPPPDCSVLTRLMHDQQHPQYRYYSPDEIGLLLPKLPSPEECSLLAAEFQQLLQENYGHADDSSTDDTDSAFLMPIAPPFHDSYIFVDYEADLKFFPHRQNELHRLSLLPYCLREVNQPLISNPCTF